MTLAADAKLEYKDGVEVDLPLAASVTIFTGAFTALNADGYLNPGADTAGFIFAGVSREHAEGGSAAGDVSALVRRKGLVKATIGSTITRANVGDKVYLVSDDTLDLAANTTNDILAGIIVEFIDSTHAWVDIEPGVQLQS